MEIQLKKGIDDLVFGMKQSDVIAIYGQPDKTFKDDEDNVIFAYNAHRLRLTFYEDEDLRLGYLISSNADLALFGGKVIGRNASDLISDLTQKGIKSWEMEDFDFAENHFNETNWLILQSEFGTVVKIELGAIINDKDEFEWKFKK